MDIRANFDLIAILRIKKMFYHLEELDKKTFGECNM